MKTGSAEHTYLQLGEVINRGVTQSHFVIEGGFPPEWMKLVRRLNNAVVVGARELTLIQLQSHYDVVVTSVTAERLTTGRRNQHLRETQKKIVVKIPPGSKLHVFGSAKKDTECFGFIPNIHDEYGRLCQLTLKRDTTVVVRSYNVVH